MSYGDAAAINDDVILALCSGHPNLKSIDVEYASNVSISSIAVAVSHCPQLRDFKTGRFRFTTVMDAAYSCYDSADFPFYKLFIWGLPMVATGSLRVALQSITDAAIHRVRMFSSLTAQNFTNDDVEAILDAFGQYLFTLDIPLAADVSNQTIEKLTRQCTALRTLFLEHCVAFTDNLVMLLADQCGHVRNLCLAGATSITNVSVCYLLQRMGSRLVHLYINQCPQLTGSTLVAIVDFCTLLETLDITGTGITADAVIMHVIMPNCLLKLGELLVDLKSQTIINNFVKKEENGANKRWWNVVEC